MAPRAVLMKTDLNPLNTAWPVNTTHYKTTVYSARPMSCFYKSAQSTVKRPYQIRTTLTNKNFSQKVNTAKGKFNTARPKAVNTARPNSAVVNAVRKNQGHSQKEDQGYVYSGCSRHMTSNMSYLLDFKEFNEGYVTFGGGAKGGRITGKGTLKTGKLDFEDVYFVKELQFNLFSLSQMCDKKNSVLFTDTRCFVLSPDFKLADESQVLLKVPRKNNMYSVDMKDIIPKESLTCLVAKAILDESILWHRRLGKQHKASSSKDETSGILKSFIIEIENLVDKKVKIIRCDNGTEFKNRVMSEFCEKKGIKREFSVARTPQTNGVVERRNRTLIEAARTMLADSKLPTTFWVEAVNTACYVQNRVLVVKPQNKTPYELFRGRTPSLSFMKPFGCHVTILNTLDYLGKFDGKSDEGFFVGYSLNSKAFRVYNIRTRKVEENLHIRFLEDKPIIVGKNSIDFVGTEESVGTCHSSKETGSSQDYIMIPLWKDGVSKESEIDDQEKPENSTQDVNTVGPSINTASTNFHTGSLNINTVSPTVTPTPLEATHADFFDDESELDMSKITTTYPSGVLTRRMTKTTYEQGLISTVYEGKTHEDLHTCLFACFLSQEEPKKTLVDLPYGKRAIGTKWVYINKKDKRGIVIRNKARLVAQGYTQEERIDYDEVFSLVARIEAIRLFLAYASFKDFVVYQMDVKSTFLYGKIKEEVYVCQPLGFEDPEFPNKVYKVEKELYGLHQAPRAWYETLSTYLLDNGFKRGQIDKTLFIKRVKRDILLVQVYVDDIIFGSTRKAMCTEFEKMMHKKFQMSSMGELTFFLGLQMTQKDDGIFISHDKYVDEILKKFSFSTVKTASTPMETSKPLLKDSEAEDVDVHLYRSMIRSLMYLTAFRPDIMFDVCACPKDSPFELEAYTDSDYASASLDRKSTTRGCQFLRSRLISWQYKKQTIVANSTTEVEYVAAASCCRQVLWIQNQMLDYRYNFMNTKIFIDKESTICIVKNLVFHSKTKHIKIRHHFIRDSNENKLIQMIKIHTDQNVADLLTKAFDDAVDYACNGIEQQLMMKFQFWNTATAKTLDNGEIEITATIDGKVKIVTEASIRRHLKLKDSDGISTLPTTEIFEQLALMGYGPVVQGEGLTHPVESHHTPTSAPSTSPPLISPTPRIPTRQESEVPQPRSSTQTPAVDEAVSTCVDVRHGGAVTSLDAGQGSGNINKTSYMPHDSPLPSGHTLGSDEGRMQHNELMDLVTKLSDRVVALETDSQQTKKIYGTVFTKLIKKVKKLEKTFKSSQARRKAKIVVSNDEDLKDPFKQGMKIAEINQDPDISLVQHDAEVQGRHEHNVEFDFEFTAAEEVYTDEKGISTVKPVSTAGAVVTTASVAVSTTRPTVSTVDDINLAGTLVGKAKMDEAEPEDIQARIKADEELAQRIQVEEREKYSKAEQARMLVELINQRKKYFATQRAEERRNKPLTQAQQRTYMSNYIKHMGSHTLQQLRRYSFDELKVLFEAIMRRSWSTKRAAEVELDQQSSNKQKTDELSQEELQQLMIIVPEEGMNIEALKPNIQSLTRRSTLKIQECTGKSSGFNSTEPTKDKEIEIWVELKRLFEPDVDDELWKSQKHIHDITWRLYDICGVHHVSIKDGVDI
ncbi:putative ribonuclease H-like domain-containing protein [Tanacetum coccineum]